MIPDVIMFVLTVAMMLGALAYGRRKQSYVVAMWALPLAWIAVFYGLLVWGPCSFQNDMMLRVSLFRPGQFGFGLLVCVFLFNGRVNESINRVLGYGERIWHSICKP